MIKVTRIKVPEVTAKAIVRHVVTANVGVRRGPPGPKGDKGDKGDMADPIEGFPLAMDNPQAGDVLRFDGEAWTNNPAADLVDGGNF